MTDSHNRPEFVKIRRKDRAMEDENWIRSFLRTAPYCVIATAVDNVPTANTNTFVYDESQNRIYFHTARAGTLRTNIETNPNVCLTMFEMGRLLPADTAAEFSVEYAGVVVFGKATIVEDLHEARGALQQLSQKYFPHLTEGEDYSEITPSEVKNTTVYRVAIEKWSGKKKKEAPDFPGAFEYADPAARMTGISSRHSDTLMSDEETGGRNDD